VLRTMSEPLKTSAPWCRGRRAKVKMDCCSTSAAATGRCGLQLVTVGQSAFKA
jgi:hypothetical protein